FAPSPLPSSPRPSSPRLRVLPLRVSASPSRSSTLTEFVLKKLRHLPPGVFRSGLVIGFRPGVVEERVSNAVVDLYPALLSEFLEPASQPIDLLFVYPRVVRCPDEQHRRRELLQHVVRRHVAVERRRRGYRVVVTR